MSRRLFYVSHAEVAVDPATPVSEWNLNPRGRARTVALAASGWPGGPCRIVSSPERKALETAQILAAAASFEVHPQMGEIDRTATGYVPHDRHEALADALFARPEKSAAGWETACAAQTRLVAALAELTGPADTRDLILVGHGGVGTLLWCHLSVRPIARSEDQPGGGHVWAIALPGRQPLHPWRSFEALTAGFADRG